MSTPLGFALSSCHFEIDLALPVILVALGGLLLIRGASESAIVNTIMVLIKLGVLPLAGDDGDPPDGDAPWHRRDGGGNGGGAQIAQPPSLVVAASGFAKMRSILARRCDQSGVAG